MRSHLFGAAAAVVLSAGLPSAAVAQKVPKFEFREPPEKVAEKIEWKAGAQAGLILTTGNSRTTTIAGGANASRKEGANKLELEVAGAFARSSLHLAADENANGAISEDEVQTISQTTTRSWMSRGRYDRFLTKSNSLYVAGLASGDKPAGKEFVGGGQLGYSRTLLKDAIHDIVVEAGYDFSYENFIAGEDIAIHSARVFASYEAKLSEDTSFSAASEILANVNSLDTPTGEADPLEDTRYLGKVSLNTALAEDVSFRFGFTAKYDHVPAPRPAFDLPYEPGFVPPADRLDTITEAVLIVNFL